MLYTYDTQVYNIENDVIHYWQSKRSKVPQL